MKQLYVAALNIKHRRISQCGKALQSVTDEFSVLYWEKELKLAQYEAHKIRIRAKLS